MFPDVACPVSNEKNTMMFPDVISNAHRMFPDVACPDANRKNTMMFPDVISNAPQKFLFIHTNVKQFTDEYPLIRHLNDKLVIRNARRRRKNTQFHMKIPLCIVFFSVRIVKIFACGAILKKNIINVPRCGVPRCNLKPSTT